MKGWSLACPDWGERLRAGKSIIPDLPLNKVAADRAVAVFNRLRLADVPGNPTLEEAAGDWFRDVVRVAFGSWDASAQERYVQEIFALVGKKNSKTSYSAGLGLTWLLLNERPNAVGIIVAPTQDIADIAFTQAEGMVLLDPGLRGKRLRVQNHLRKITNLRTGAALEIFTFDPSILTGQKPAFWLLDELHVIAKNAKAASALGQLRGGMISQPEALGVIITTQSDSPPTGIFKIELAKARGIRDGRNLVTRTLPVLYEFPPEIARDPTAWRDPANWPMVVPNNGRSITIGRLEKSFADAEEAGPEEIRRWASQHLNIEIGVGLLTDHWPGTRHWEKNGDPTLTLAEILDRSDLVTIGIDGGGLYDLLGLSVLGRDRQVEMRGEKPVTRWLHWGHAWLHRGQLDVRKQEVPKFLELEALGELTLVDELATAYSELVAIVAEINELGILAKVGLDPWGVKLIVDALRGHGITEEGDQVQGVGQGFKLNGDIKSVESKLDSGLLTHCAQPLMSWAIGNARQTIVGNNAMITKQASGTGKIDPLMALFDSAVVMLRAPEIDGPSVYNNETARPDGFLVV